jgi:hypothetical protein
MTKLAGIPLFALLLYACADKNNDRSYDRAVKRTKAIVASTANPYVGIDISPMDMSYFPENYSQKKMNHEIAGSPIMRVIYSRPQKNGRTIFGDVLAYGKPWRLGANEASEIEFFKSVTIQNQKVNAGRYIIYCIPYEDKWTMVLNTDLYTWGLKIDSTKDLMHFDIAVKKSAADVEYFTMVFQPDGNGADLLMTWDNVEARLTINF